MFGLRSESIAYRLRTGMDYNGQRHEEGEVVTDIPPESIEWLTAQGHIEPVIETEGGE